MATPAHSGSRARSYSAQARSRARPITGEGVLEFFATPWQNEGADRLERGQCESREGRLYPGGEHVFVR
jgi:hypothetical protein